MPDDKKTIEPIQAAFDDVARAMIRADDLPSKPLEATHRGILPIGGLQLECYVLEDGRRVFAKRGMARAIGLKSEGGNAFLKTLGGKKLGSEISTDLRESLENPIVFNISGADPAHGFEGETLVEVCKAVIRADEAGKLLESQKPMAAQARAIVNALTKVLPKRLSNQCALRCAHHEAARFPLGLGPVPLSPLNGRRSRRPDH